MLKKLHLILLLLLLLAFHLESTQSTIPVLDLNEYKAPETRARFIRQMKNSLSDMGFFALKNFGVSELTLRDVRTSSRNFFALNLAEKMHFFDTSVNGQRGYTPGESAREELRIDYKEFFSIGREGGLHKNYDNIWPHQVNLKEPLLALYKEIETGKKILEQAFAEAIGLPIEFFNQITKEGECLLRTLHYPAMPPSDYVWSAAHTDINLFSITLPATAKGLQYKTKDGEWIDATISEDLVLVHAGDMLENLTNGLFRGAFHRVVSGDTRTGRYAVIYYNHGRYSHRMDPLPQCIQMTGGEVRYPKASVRELLEERLVDLGLAGYEMMVRLAESGLIEREIALGRVSMKALRVLNRAGLTTQEMKGILAEEK